MRTSSVFIRPDVIDELTFALAAAATSYQACLLVGAVRGDGVELLGYNDLAQHDDAIAFAHELLTDWTPMVRRLRKQTPELRVLGWASYLPGRTIGPDDAERFVHKTFFNLPHQVTLTVDEHGHLRAFGVDANRNLTERPVGPLPAAEEGAIA